jgi:hypothetical protein
MKDISVIPAFPSGVNREAFGSWLSGFVDGEGCFQLRNTRICRNDRYYRAPYAGFYIKLRADDSAILQRIQSYWGCGILNNYVWPTPRTPNPCRILRVYPLRYLADILVPHFDRFSLQSKKARDYTIWREAVLLLREINLRPVNAKKGQAGTKPKRSDAELDRFVRLYEQLRALRPYDSSLAGSA